MLIRPWVQDGGVCGTAIALSRKVLVTDTFTRADSATTLANAETGQAWSALTGTWGISSNQAYLAVNAGVDDYAVVDAGISDGTVTVTFGAPANNQYLAFRATDANNVFVASSTTSTTLNLYRRSTGTYNQIGTASHTWATGDVVSVWFVGAAITVSVNGVALITATDSFQQTATKHGIGAGSSGTSWRWDNFKVTS